MASFNTTVRQMTEMF